MLEDELTPTDLEIYALAYNISFESKRCRDLVKFQKLPLEAYLKL